MTVSSLPRHFILLAVKPVAGGAAQPCRSWPSFVKNVDSPDEGPYILSNTAELPRELTAFIRRRSPTYRLTYSKTVGDFPQQWIDGRRISAYHSVVGQRHLVLDFKP